MVYPFRLHCLTSPQLQPRLLQLCVQGRWYTWIDYDRFLELAKSGKPFTTMDYASPTPEWALVGHAARGFDPREVRYKKERKTGARSAE